MDCKRLVNWRVVVMVLLIAAGSIAGCDRSGPGDSAAVAQGPADGESVDGEEDGAAAVGQAAGAQDENTEDTPREHYYSPYVITVDSDVVFKAVTFTDVGISQPDPGRMDNTMYEAIAESLAMHLNGSASLGYSAQVYHDEAMADPDNHLFCEESHLYVALWKGYAPDRWGYSLWSGCNAEHQFGWKEVVIPEEAKDDLIDSVEPLTTSIVESLEEATKKNCFVSDC